MKRFLSAVGFSLLAFGGLNQANAATDLQEPVAALFMDICLGQLPGYEGVYKILQSKGYELAPYGPAETATEFEFGDPETNIWGAFEVGGDSPGCAVYREGIAEGEMRNVAKRIIRKITGEVPKIWAWGDSEPSAWTAPYQGQVLYIFFNGTGLAIDTREA